MPQKYWWKRAKIYELYVDRFAGDFKGLGSKLDYFNYLGINTLHVLPHYPSPMIDDGYDVSDYRGIRKKLGTINDFRDFIREAHRHDVRVIIDFILNHTSNQHPWFIEAKASKTNPKRDYFLWSDTNKKMGKAVNAFPDIKNSNWIWNKATKDYYFATFYPQQPDLNWDNPKVMTEMVANMNFWCDIGVDGFRLDAASYLIKRGDKGSQDLPETHKIIKEIHKRLKLKYPNVMLLGEVNLTPRCERKYFGVGDECHMVYHFPLMEQIWLALICGKKASLKRMVKSSFTHMPDNCQWATFLRNHDELSLSTLLPGERKELIKFIDPKGLYVFNRGSSVSARLATAFKGNKQKIIEAIKLLYSLPGAPIMYYGDELGMKNLPPQKAITDTRKYVRGFFDWKEAHQQMRNPASLLNKVAKIIHNSHP